MENSKKNGGKLNKKTVEIQKKRKWQMTDRLKLDMQLNLQIGEFEKFEQQ